MKPSLICWLASGLAVLAQGQTNAPPPNILPPPNLVPATVLAWDADLKEYAAKTNDLTANFTFWATNVSPTNVSILSVSSSCGCTVAQLPSQPWNLGPGSYGPIKVTVDLRGRYGAVMKGVTVNSSAGVKALVVRADVPVPQTPGPGFAVPPAQLGVRAEVAPLPASPAPLSDERARNLQVAMRDRQAVFKNEACARCHAEPARGKMGRELYAGVCGICHEATPRAAMVSDLRQPKQARRPGFWKQIIAEGQPGTLMPAFAASEGGPLTDEQVASLADYMEKNFPKNPPASATAMPVPPNRKW